MLDLKAIEEGKCPYCKHNFVIKDYIEEKDNIQRYLIYCEECNSDLMLTYKDGILNSIDDNSSLHTRR